MTITPLHLAALAVAAVPDLQAVGTRGPHIQTNDFIYGGVLDQRGRHWIVKYPRNTHAGTVIEAEAGIAPVLIEQLRRGSLPFDVVRPAGFAQADFGRAMVYSAPLGRPRNFESIGDDGAHELGRTLAAIHLLSPDVIADAGMPVYSAESTRKRLLTELHDAAASADIPRVLFRRWENALECDELWDFTPRVIHGDVAPENVLWSEGRVSAVLGFGESQVGDPAADFAFLVSGVDESLFDAIFESYSNAMDSAPDGHFFTRTVLLSELALAKWLMFGVRQDNSAIIADARGMLDDLATDVESDPELAPGPAWHMDVVEETDGDEDVISSRE